MYDTQAMGLLGLNAALAAAAIAGAKLLGHLWWLAIIGLLISSLVAGSALFLRAREVGLDLTSSMGLAGKASSAADMDQAIVVSLSAAIDSNDGHLKDKRDRVWGALVLLVASIIGAIIGVLIF